MRLLLIILLCYSGGTAFSQHNYCVNEVGKTIDFLPKQTDSIYTVYASNGDTEIIKIINPTDHTIYLFKSYFREELQSSRYIHEVDEKSKTYYISFVPIVSYLATRLSDNIIIGENSIVHKGQVLYDFIKLEPNTYYDLMINYNTLFRRSKSTQNAVKSYDNKSLNKYSGVNFKFLTTSKLNGKYHLVFEFALYDNVDVLCKELDYYLNEFEFDKNAKSYSVLAVPIKLNNPGLPLFE